MRSPVRVSLLALLVSALLAVAASAAQAAIGIEKFAAVNCSEGHGSCAEERLLPSPFTVPKEPSKAESEAEGYTQAGGHVPYGITDFKVTTVGELVKGEAQPTGVVTHVRTDVAPGLATSLVAVPQCKMEEFGSEVPGTGLYTPPVCNADTEIGVNKVIIALYTETGTFVTDVPLEGKVYNLEPPNGRPTDFGVALELPESITGHKGLFAHTMIEGGVEWGKEAKGTGAADYHDYYEINVSPKLPLIRSRLVLEGRRGAGDFITNATSCPGNNTTRLSVTGAEGTTAIRSFTTPIGLTGCNLVPFAPTFTLTPETTLQDKPDGLTTELALPRHPGGGEIDTSQLNTAEVMLPEGMTLNPAAAGEVTQACTPAQARIGTAKSGEFGVECPAASKIGTDTIEVPTLPAKSLTGEMFLGGPESGPITGPPYTVYLNAESKRYGVNVRLKGLVTPNEATGRLKVTFAENPEQPFSNAILSFNGGALAPVANPLACGTATTSTSLVPYIGSFATQTPSSSFTVSGEGAGGACPSPLPFALGQSTFNQSPGYAGAKTSYTLNIQRSDGQQYLSQIRTVLPEGLIGLLPTVTQCPEPQAGKGECPGSSEIGKVAVSAGAGTKPYGFRGTVYLTGPYGGAPFGMTVVVPAVAGPFNLGNVITRGTINVETYTARVVATANLPTIVGGIPLRLKGISVEINKQGFLQNPTNCGALATETTLTSTLGATQTLSTPFQVSNCNALAFKPAFGAATGAKTSKANGASLETTINVPAGDANVKSVMVQLPKQLPSRLTTLQKACPEATFASNPYHCPSGSFVGGVRANTPALSVKMKGPAILVSHGGRAFPDLDLLLEGEGVRVILVGNTNIKNGITTTTFAAPPDVPVTSITVNLPVGAHSALAANGNVCASKLVMPTTIVGQNGVTFKQNATIRVNNCPVRIVGHKVVGNAVYLTVQTYSPGRISGKGNGLANTFRALGQAQKTASLKVPLSRAGRGRGRPFRTKVRVGFLPRKKGTPSSAAFVTVTFG